MTLKVRMPAEVLFEEKVSRIRAEARDGWFGILPRHIDFVTALVPGILRFQPCGAAEEYLAIDHGILVKCGAEVSISTRNAVRGGDLGQLKKNVEAQFGERAERERQGRELESRLEADLVRHLLQAEKNG
ncbi:MAG TPA: F0F1 ATP synthase subunit epsilon [Bryobacteraceae bacterium]|jgi:F-type H+-transporting ATPase subunit epsilon|nr:F0F1 ATP synthase subunit epsilon [Bryobacteraceae bacterium]